MLLPLDDNAPLRATGDFSDRHCKSFRDTATLYEHTSHIDYATAINNPTAGWPAYRDLYGVDEIDSLPHDSVFSEMKFDNFLKERTFQRISMAAPTSRALRASGATPVDHAGPWKCVLKMELRERHSWDPSIEFGYSRNGVSLLFVPTSAASLYFLVSKHVATRRIVGGELLARGDMGGSSFREFLHFLRAPLQVGAPASMSTDVPLGFSFAGYQSSTIALELCDGRKDIPLRM